MIYVDEKAARNNWNANPKLCEDVFEALIGAIYLDLGLVHAKRFILNIFENIDIDLEEVREFLKKFTHGGRLNVRRRTPTPRMVSCSTVSG